MTHLLRNKNGNRIILGKKVGTGGEGSIYRISGKNQLVAKIYHNKLSQDKQDKLIAMTKMTDRAVHQFTAWPLDILMDEKRNICGFIMRELSDNEPLHHLYNPAHRKQIFPKADWSFLVHTAMNIATAFATIHAKGIVIGDINQNLIFINKQAMVTLIDCDSFQIQHNEKIYYCEVGVAHFTPPELQGLSFKGIKRNSNHDNFALALIMFHLLMMGVHPFSGVPLAEDTLPPLEKAIQKHLYAYSERNNIRSQIKPPPSSIAPYLMTNELAQTFELAFVQGNADGNRPTALDWMNLLKPLLQKIATCKIDKMHKFPSVLASCPWCRHSNEYFLPKLTGAFIADDFATLERKINEVSPPIPETLYTQSDIQSLLKSITGKPIVSEAEAMNKAIQKELTSPYNLILGSILGLLVIAITPTTIADIMSPVILSALIPWSMLTLFVWGRIDDIKQKVRWVKKGQIEEREDALKQAQQALEARENRITLVYKQFDREKDRLSRQLQEYKNLGNQQQAEALQLRQQAKKNEWNHQLHNYLDSFLIDQAQISQIGETRKSTLSSFGIVTAADINSHKIGNIPGFGQLYIQTLVDWRKKLEKRFTFKPSNNIDKYIQKDLQTLQMKFYKKGKSIRKQLLDSPQELDSLKHSIQKEAHKLESDVKVALRKMVQAQADLELAQASL